MVDTEEYFPRGGKKPTVTHFKQSSNFLGAPEKKEGKKKKPKKKSEGDDGYLSDEVTKDYDQSYKNCAIGLSYKVAKQGTLVLGRVRQVQETKVYVMLPCKMIGVVMACYISETYNKLLEAYVNDQSDKILDLRQMFRPGQYVAVQVLEASEQKTLLSMMPQHVNSGKMHTHLHKGAVLQAAVVSVEDHGYVMDIGIPNTRAFLPKDKANPDIQLDAGMVTWCAVKSLAPSPESSVVTLSGELTALQNGFMRKSSKTPLLPGTALEFIVDTPLDNGIEGHVFDNVTAYIQRQHADTVKGKKPGLGQKIRARVLYVMPTRNTPFLTMKNIFETTYPDLSKEQEFKEGDIVENAQVLKITGRSIHFKLSGRSVGTLSVRRIQVDEDLDDEQVIAKSYPPGSTHKVRIICYNLSDYNYSISDQPTVLQQKYFSLDQLAVGEIVTGVVKSVADNHLLLTVGRQTGYVPHTHFTDAGVFVDPKKASISKLPKKKFKVGQEVKARVLNVDLDKPSLLLTLKPTLLAQDLEILHSYDQAEIGKGYTGFIKHIRDYILVSFFNNVSAYVPRNYVTKEQVDSLVDMFHLGQIVNCTILKVDLENKKMSGSLTTTPFWPAKKFEKTKRRQNSESADDVPNKKHKSDDEEVKPKKKQKKDQEEDANTKDRKRKKDKKQKIEEENKQAEDSDAIDTDIQDNQVLTEDDLKLIDLTDCNSPKAYKKRIALISKHIESLSENLNTIDSRISKIENKGLNAKNKKTHTALHTEKLVLEERVEKLLYASKLAQDKLNEASGKSEKKGKEGKKKEEVEQKEQKLKVIENLEPVLEIPSAKGFWSTKPEDLVKPVQDEESSSSEDEEQEQPKKKRKKLTVAEKLSKVREEEERVREMERRAIESEAQPMSVEQFERALLANPDSSQLWIAYMAFHLQATEIEKARAVGRKALNTISFREEQEKLNVWLAMLNFENRFGTKESQQKTLEEALQMNDTFKIHSKLLDIYVETSKQQELASLVELMLRKYKRDANMYQLCGAACYKLGMVDKARHVMQKAISVLEKKQHVSVLVQFALLERYHGARERAEALFEQVLAVYPQRVDVCSVYVDMLLKSGDVDLVRQVMERMTSQKLPARKMKILFKKWIEVEEKVGDEEQVEKIRQRAMEYVDKAKF